LAATEFGAKDLAPTEFGTKDLAPTESGANNPQRTDAEMDLAPTKVEVCSKDSCLGPRPDKVAQWDARDSRIPSRPVLG
jgi:hypothetical protein